METDLERVTRERDEARAALDELSELHRIESELYCRERGIPSEPWVTHTRRGA
jgi:hypothetical protein